LIDFGSKRLLGFEINELQKFSILDRIIVEKSRDKISDYLLYKYKFSAPPNYSPTPEKNFSATHI